LSGREAGDWQAETRCHLFGLEALLRAHIEREERYLIPLLEEELPAPQAEAPARSEPASS
jgi:hypothetical protein